VTIPPPQARARVRTREPRRRHRGGAGPWLVVPAVLLLGVFVVRPLVRTAELSLHASDIIGNPTRFVGLANYVALLTDPGFLRVTLTTIIIALLGTTIAITTALVAALLLRRSLPGGPFFSIVLSLPFAYSAASASAVFAGLFAPSVGILNVVLGSAGVDGPAWLSDPVAAIGAVSIATGWYEFGFAFLVLTAAVRAVPPEIVEAAQLDGAGGWRLATGILIPVMRPSILFLAVTGTISGLQTFAQIQVLTRGGPGGATTTFVFQLFQLAFGNGTPDFGRASVVAIVLVVIVTAVTILQFRIFGRPGS
jgi:sn-glycerol 3-phosphate transport system permease protein